MILVAEGSVSDGEVADTTDGDVTTRLRSRVELEPTATDPDVGEAESVGDGWARSTVGRAFALLNAFSSKSPFLTLGELSERANLPRSTTHRLAVVLVNLGALQRRGNLGYTIGSRMFDVGLLAPARSRLLAAAEPYLHDLHEVTRATVHLAGWSGQQAIYLSKVTQPGARPLPSRLGAPIALHATALGKCLLAFSPNAKIDDLEERELQRFTPYTVASLRTLRRDVDDIRSGRVARDGEQSVLGISCIAAPIEDRRGQCVAAISISVPSTRLRERAMEQAAVTAARNISRVYGQGLAV
jgi:IclR family acetate operon transcriptional repressor